jgi:hypothetical protein
VTPNACSPDVDFVSWVQLRLVADGLGDDDLALRTNVPRLIAQWATIV